MDGHGSELVNPEIIIGQVAYMGPRLESLVSEVRRGADEVSSLRQELGDHVSGIAAELQAQREMLEKVLLTLGAGRNTMPVAMLEYSALSQLEHRARQLTAAVDEEPPALERAEIAMGALCDALENLDNVRKGTEPGRGDDG